MRFLDVARGGYVRSPLWLRKAAAPAIALLSPGLQYGQTYATLRKDIARSRSDAAFVAERQLAALRHLVALAITGSSYWRSRFKDAFPRQMPDPATFAMDDLARLAPIGRMDVATFAEGMLAVPISQVDSGYSSGSSGKPIAFYLDKDRSPKEWAFTMNTWGRSGFSERDARCVFRAVPIENGVFEWEPALRELRLSPWSLTPASMDLYLDLIDKHKTRYVHGYPSSLEIFCRHMLRTGRRPKLPIVGLFPISEPVWPHQRQIFSETLPEARLVTQYGLSERVAFAGCTDEQGEIYAFEPLYGITELLDEDDRPVTEPGHIGRIVATGFLSTSMPLIRYDTGDTAKLIEPAADTNAYHLTVREIIPKASPGFLIGRDGQRFDADWCVQHGHDIWRNISEYQFYQDTPGVAELRIVPVEACDERDIMPFVNAVRHVVGDNLHVVPRLVDAVETNTRGKRKIAIQKLDLSLY